MFVTNVKIIEQNGIKKTINERNILDIELNNGDIVASTSYRWRFCTFQSPIWLLQNDYDGYYE